MPWKALLSLGLIGCGGVQYESGQASAYGYDPPRLTCGADSTCEQVDRLLAQITMMKFCDLECTSCEATTLGQTRIEALVTTNDQTDGCQAWRMRRFLEIVALGSRAVPTLARELSVEVRVHARVATAALIALGRSDLVDHFCSATNDYLYRDEVCRQ